MAHFFGTVQGGRGETSRLGHASSGLRTRAASWRGAVEVELTHDDETGADIATVRLVKHKGHGTERVLYQGPVSG
jgi:hypothetical protein